MKGKRNDAGNEERAAAVKQMARMAGARTWVPLTLLSERVPRTDDAEAFGWWIAGHFVYGAVLAVFGAVFRKKGRKR